MSVRTLGVIGGSGLYQMPGLTDVEEHVVTTSFGAPSDVITSGKLGDTRLFFLPRHARGHKLAPHKVNYRANILALKMLGAEQLVSVSAVGSMQESIHPGDMVLVNQFIDCTRQRINTFFDAPGCVAHVGFADPVDAALQQGLYRAALDAGARVRNGGTYVCIEGPQFSTRAESNLYRSWGVDVIGMTAMPEAKLAREAELPYAVLALATDYDCWHVDEEAVSVDAVVAVIQKNVKMAQTILQRLAANLPDPANSPASNALKGAIITAKDQVAEEARLALKPLLSKYL